MRNLLGKKLTIHRLSFVLVSSTLLTSQLYGQTAASVASDTMRANAERQEQLKQIASGKAAYAAAIVSRWETAARDAGKWDENYETDFSAALVKLSPEKLLAIGQAQSFPAVQALLIGGTPMKGSKVLASSQTVSPATLGSYYNDLVFTPVPQCRIVDTRAAGGQISPGSPRNFDADGSNFSAQGGAGTSCGVPFAVSRAVVMIIHATGASKPGNFNVYAYAASPIGLSTLNYPAGQIIATTAIVPVTPGSGADFTVAAAGSPSHAIIDVVGYFAAPVSAPLACYTTYSNVTEVPVNVWTAVDVACSDDTSATGGGFLISEGTLGAPGVIGTPIPYGNGWRTYVDNQSSGVRNVQTYVRCCSLPGR